MASCQHRSCHQDHYCILGGMVPPLTWALAKFSPPDVGEPNSARIMERWTDAGKANTSPKMTFPKPGISMTCPKALPGTPEPTPSTNEHKMDPGVFAGAIQLYRSTTHW